MASIDLLFSVFGRLVIETGGLWPVARGVTVFVIVNDSSPVTLASRLISGVAASGTSKEDIEMTNAMKMRVHTQEFELNRQSESAESNGISEGQRRDELDDAGLGEGAAINLEEQYGLVELGYMQKNTRSHHNW